MQQNGFSAGMLLAMGVAIGVALGVALHNNAVGIGIGLGIAGAYALIDRATRQFRRRHDVGESGLEHE